MKILGIDYGKKKIGLATSEGFLVEPFKIIPNKSWRKSLPKICLELGIRKIVLGLAEGKLAPEQYLFARKLKEMTGLPVEFQDETLTTQEAIAKMKEVGKRVKNEDAVSAALILQAYLEKNV